MELKIYQAYSMSDALAQIRKDLGAGAVILHTRTFHRGGFLGFGRKTIVEVTASGSAQVRRQPRPNLPASRENSARRVASQSSDPKEGAPAGAAQENSVPRKPPHRATLKPQHTTPASARIEVKPIESAGRPAPAKGPAVPINPMPVDPGTAAPPSARKHEPRPVAPEPGDAHPVARRFVIDVETGRVRRVTADDDAADRTLPEKPKVAGASQADSGSGPTKAARSVSGESIPDRPAIRETEKPPARAKIVRSVPGRVADAMPTPVPALQPTAPPVSPSPEQQLLKQELAALRQMVGQVLQKQTGSSLPQMPEALLTQYVALVENEVAQDLADEICGLVRQELSAEDLKDPERIREAVSRHLSRQIPVAEDTTRIEATDDGRPLTVALVGPTGVGKTTTIAKLAAAFKLREGRCVGLITTDTYRIAAVDQLRTYANIIGVPLKVALTPAEMSSACHALRECDVILIDTAGRSPNDEIRIDEIREFIDAAAPHEVHLVLSSTASESVLMRTVDQFSAVKTDRVILTKLDEAVGFGVVVNVMRKVGKALSFVTTGQEVPDHIEAGRPDRLARLILGEKVHE